MNRIKLLTLSIALGLSSIAGVVLSSNNPVAAKAAYTQIDAGSPKAFRFNPNNRNDGFYFTLPENIGPYNSDYSVNYYPMNEYCLSLTRDGVTTNLCVVNSSYPRDTLKKISPTEYYMRTIDGWTMQSGFLPFKALDRITISGSFYSGNYQLNIQESSFELDANGNIFAGKTVRENLVIDGEVRANNLEKSSSRGLYFETNENRLYYNNSWAIRYHASSDDYNVAVARDTTYSNFKDKTTDGYIVAYDSKRFYADFWYFADYKFQDGDILHFNGEYTYLDPKTETKYIFKIENGVFLLTESSGIIYASLLEDYGEHLLNKLTNNVDIDIYTSESQSLIYDKIHEYKLFVEEGNKTFMECWDKYVLLSNMFDSLPQDEAAKQVKLNSYKKEAIEKVNSYANLSLYLDNDRLLISNKLELTISSINSATSKNEVDTFVKEYKSYVDLFNFRDTIYGEQVLLNNPVDSTSINTEYLEKYDVVSLNDLGQEEDITLSSDPSLKQKNINTDATFDNTNENTYPVSKDNSTNSVVFRFKYVVNDNDMNLGVAIKLRGIRYCGYKVMLNDNNYGIYLKRTLKASEDFLAGVSDCFKYKGEYLVELGAIDIVDTNKTFFYASVNGILLSRVVCDKLPYGDNRLDLKAEMSGSNIKVGSVTLKELNESPKYNGVHLGRFDVIDNNDKSITLTAAKNSLPSNISKSIHSYALRKDSIRLERNNEVTSIAKTDTPIIHKTKDDTYSFDTYVLANEFMENDKLIIEGYFASFDSDNSVKTPFYVSKSELVYHSGTWVRNILTLDEAKEDALYILNNYANEEDYSSRDYASICTLISNGVGLINSCTSIEEVNRVLEQILSELSHILTILEKNRVAIISTIETYIESIKDSYYEKELLEINELFDLYKNLINQSNSTIEMNVLEQRFYDSVSLIATKVEKDAQMLKEAKEDAKAKIRDYYGKCNIDSLSKEEADLINLKVEEALTNIDAATSIEEVTSIYESLIKVLSDKFNKGQTNNNSGSCSGSLTATSAIIVIISLLGLSLTLLKKYRKKELD